MKAEIERIMDLQPLWDHRKTPEMDERGKLVRANGPNWLRDFAEELAGEIGIPVTDLLVEGRDGTGPKTEVPWFRFASKERSPSATTDWY
ncbi:MAG: MrcB family domain-containing protein, partial [Ilumatobacteraceae bacterium]